MRQRIDRQRIEQFLQRLGREFSGSGRIYLVDGTTMVYEGLRQQTLDIDLAIEVPDAEHSDFIAVVRDLKNKLSMNIEEASPGDFIPLPSGYRERSPFIGRFGQLDVFYFDFYSIALSKIERGTGQDILDVKALLSEGHVDFEMLRNCFNEIFPLLATDSLKQDPKEFQRKFELLEKIWRDS